MVAGAKFILGLNFESYDFTLARAQLQAGRDRMPQGSVITYEIGNEVSAWSLSMWVFQR